MDPTRNSIAFIVATAIAAGMQHLAGWPLVTTIGIVAAVIIVAIIRRGPPPGVPVAVLLLLLAAPVHADEPPIRGPLITAPALNLRNLENQSVVPPAAIIAPPLCTPLPKPAPAWASYLGWGLAAATEIATLAVTLYQRAP